MRKTAPQYNPKMEAAAKILRKTGMKISRAMLLAGYSPSTAARNGAGGNGTVRAALVHAQQDFVKRFANKAEDLGLTPEYTVAKLRKIADSPVAFESLGAVKEYHNVILKSQFLETKIALANNGMRSAASINLNFILPASNAHATDESWKAAAIEAQTSERENERAMVASQQNEAHPVRARTHNLRGQAFKDKMPESWHMNRSATVRKAWDKRGRLSAEGKAKAARKAEAMGLKAKADPDRAQGYAKDMRGMRIAKAKNKRRRTK